MGVLCVILRVFVPPFIITLILPLSLRVSENVRDRNYFRKYEF